VETPAGCIDSDEGVAGGAHPSPSRPARPSHLALPPRTTNPPTRPQHRVQGRPHMLRLASGVRQPDPPVSINEIEGGSNLVGHVPAPDAGGVHGRFYTDSGGAHACTRRGERGSPSTPG